MNKPAIKITLTSQSAKSFSSLRRMGITLILAPGVTKRGVAKLAARFVRLLPYLTTNPAAAYVEHTACKCITAKNEFFISTMQTVILVASMY